MIAGATVVDRAWAVLRTVPDPELPTVSLCDLGIVRDVLSHADGGVEVVITPTYSGCPATSVIEGSVHDALQAAGIAIARVTTRRAPAWSSDWISETGRRALHEAGIVPPGPAATAAEQPIRLHRRIDALACPLCGSPRTERLSAFGATPCKALHRCLACREPFEAFKAI